MSTTSNLKNPLVIRQGSTQDWGNDFWPTIDNSIVNPKNQLSKELLKLKIFPLRMRLYNSKLTVIYYKWYQRVFKSRVHLRHYRYLKKHLIHYIQKKGNFQGGIRRKRKGKKRYSIKKYWNQFKVSQYHVIRARNCKKLFNYRKKRGVKTLKKYLHRKFIEKKKIKKYKKQLKKWFKHREKYVKYANQALVNKQKKRKVKNQVIDANYKVVKIEPLSLSQKLITKVKKKCLTKQQLKKQKLAGPTKKVKKYTENLDSSLKRILLVKKLRKGLRIINAKNISFKTPQIFLNKLNKKYLNDLLLFLKKKRGRGYRFNKYRYFTYNKLFPKNAIISKELKAIQDFSKLLIQSKTLKKNNLGLKWKPFKKRIFNRPLKHKKVYKLLVKKKVVKNSYLQLLKKTFHKRIGNPWTLKMGVKNIDLLWLLKRGFRLFHHSQNIKSNKNKLYSIKKDSIITFNKIKFTKNKYELNKSKFKFNNFRSKKDFIPYNKFKFKNKSWVQIEKGNNFKKSWQKRKNFSHWNKNCWTPWWMRLKTIRRCRLNKRIKKSILTKKIHIFSRKFKCKWKRRAIYLKVRRKLKINSYMKFRKYCRYITNYCIPSLTLWELRSIFSQLSLEIKNIALINIFKTGVNVRKLSYLLISKNFNINDFLRKIKFLKYSVDAALLHLLVLTGQANSNVISYLIAQMLARNAPKKKQRALISIIRQIQNLVITYIRRSYLKSLIDPLILRVKITGKLAGSLRTRNYFIGPRHLPLHSIAHPIETSQAMVNTKYGIFTIRVWCW